MRLNGRLAPKDELYFFYNSKIIKVTFNENFSSFELTEFKKDIKNIQLKLSEDNREYATLIINLVSGDEFIFNSLKIVIIIGKINMKII